MPSRTWQQRFAMAAVALGVGLPARAEDATPGYPERVLQWTVKNGESCDDVAAALYGSAKHRALLERYNAVSCKVRRPLPDGMTLVVPAKVTDLPTARLRAMKPNVNARPAGGSWAPAAPGMPLHRHESVNTLTEARADILFVDRTRVVLAEHTLVVIYGTASRTAVSKTPPTVDLETGEVQAGLAALRGKPVEVAVQGGRVSARSRDTAVRSRDQRATVSVFDGSANVASAGKSVSVPANHGTSFVRDQAPAPPRPLPPAPKWVESSATGVLLAAPGAAVVGVGWEAVAGARAYRVELARDAEFSNLVAREEVPEHVRSFRGEQLPPGTYFLRVRAIDAEDYLGVAAQARSVTVVEARLDPAAGSIGASAIEASPYGAILLGGSAGIEIKLDDGPFGALPERVDLLRLGPRRLALRVRGETGSSFYEIRYRDPGATVTQVPAGPGALTVRVDLQGMDGVDVSGRVAPSLRVRQGAVVRRVELAPGSGAGSLQARVEGLVPGTVELDVVDARGRVLGSASAELPSPPRLIAPEPRSFIGVVAPPVLPSAYTDVVWWAPLPRDAVAASSTGYLQDGQVGAQIAARASGSSGAFGFQGLLTTREIAGSAADSSAWLAARWRPMVGPTLQAGPSLELGIPLTDQGPGTRVGLGIGAGARWGRVGWIANLGGRLALKSARRRSSVPDGQGYLLTGGTYDVMPWIRGYSVLDLHAWPGPATARGGLSVGAELGHALFGGVALRASPWDDAGGTLLGQLSVGVRER